MFENILSDKKAFEQKAIDNGCKLSALAMRRTTDFYSSIEYKESAACFRKLL